MHTLIRFALGTLLISGVALARADASPQSATPRSTVERIREAGLVRCGAVERPGLAEDIGGDRWAGLEVELCRAVASAVLGDPDKIEFHDYDSPQEFALVRDHKDDLSFLSYRELLLHDLTAFVVPGPAVYIAQTGVLVPGRSAEKHLADLAGKGICFLSGDNADNNLNDWFDLHGADFIHHAYSEQGEMDDAFAVQRCHAIAGETTLLGTLHLYRNMSRLEPRQLPEPLAQFPILAVTGNHDAPWAALVAWVIDTVISAERPGGKWHEGADRAMLMNANPPGLLPGWQARVLKQVGHYGDLYERHLGVHSKLRLERGANRSVVLGGALSGPILE